MILLKELLEAIPSVKKTNFSAISKKTGKLVYFNDKEHLDAAIKSGTHEEPKNSKSSDKISQKGYKLSGDDFKSSAEKSKDNINTTNEPSNDLVNAIKNDGIGSTIIRLYRKNKNGKLVNDVEMSQKDITGDMLKQALDTFDIPVNDLNQFPLDTKVSQYGRKVPITEVIKNLVINYLQWKQFAPDGIAANPDYYKAYSYSVQDSAKIIKKAIKPKEDKKPVETKESGVTYDVAEVSEITNILSSMKDNGGFGWNPNSKDILKTANKYGIDINRILSNPERFLEIEGYSPEDKSAKEFALQALGHTASFVNDKTAIEDSYHLVGLQLAYPIKYKELSDSEWKKKMVEEDNNPTTVDGALRKFTKDENFSSEKINEVDDINRKSQSEWVRKQDKNKEYANDMMGYQQMISKSSLEKIDKLLISTPPPPIQADALYRGMAMKPSELNKFIKNFSEGQDISLPISSFSLDPSVATGFSNNVNNDNALINKSNNQSVLIKVVNKNNTFNGFGMNANIGNATEVSDNDKFGNWGHQTEVLLPSNNQYKTLKVETKKMEGGRSFTVITLEQIGVKNEQFIRLKELIDDENFNNLKKHLQYPNRISLLYKKKGE